MTTTARRAGIGTGTTRAECTTEPTGNRRRDTTMERAAKVVSAEADAADEEES